MKSVYKFLLIFCVLFSGITANATELKKLSKEQLYLLDLAQDHLDKVKTIEASFIQFSPNSDLANGKFYLSKPGLLKMSYSTPFNIDYYIRNDDLIQYDHDLDEVSRGSAPENPLKVLLYEGLLLANNNLLEVTDVIDEGSTFNIYLVTKGNEITEITGMILKFTKTPLEIAGIQRISNDGKRTDVTFSNVTTNSEIKKSVFEFSRPKAKYPNSK